jgi:lambda family phage portal protein
MKFFEFFSRSKPEPAKSDASSIPPEIARNIVTLFNGWRSGKTSDDFFDRNQIRSLNQKLIRSFDAAVTNNFNQDFRGTFGSANSEIFSSQYVARARARTVCKDTPHGKAALRVIRNNIVGHRGFRLKMRVGKKDATGKFKPETDLNDIIQDEYKIAGRPENFTVRKNISRNVAFGVIAMSGWRDGSLVVRMHRGYPNNKYGFAVELLEADRLQESYCGKSQSGNAIRFSIEYDRWNTPVTYWLLTRHPGDVFGTNPFGGQAAPKNWREQVPAKDILHYNNVPDRAEADVGFSEMDAAMQHMHRDRQYETALALAAIASCCKPFWIKKLFPTGMNFADPQDFASFWERIKQAGNAGNTGPDTGAAMRQQGIGVRSEVVSPASTWEAEWGQELQQIDPKFPIEAATGFKKDNLEAVAVALGISYQALSGNFQNLGFSASRSSELPQRDNFQFIQEHFIDIVVRPHFREWLRCSIMAGIIPVSISRLEEIVDAASWQGVRWPFINPLQDVQAMILAQEAGITCPQQIQDNLPDGEDLDDLYAMQAEAKELQELHGLNYSDVDVTRPIIDKGEPGQVTPAPDAKGAAQPPAKTKTANPVRRSRGYIARQVIDLLALQGDGRNGHSD